MLQCDDGSWLPESNAILVHVARGTPFWPESDRDRDRVLAWLMFEQSEVEPIIGSARFWLLTGRDRGRADELQRRIDWARRTLAILDHELVRPWLVGDRATIADLAVYAYTHLAGDIGLAVPSHVADWCRRIETLPGYVRGPAPYDASAMLAPE